MNLEITAEKLAKTAKRKIGAFKMVYTFEHLQGAAPDVVRGRGTVGDSKTSIDINYFPDTGNLNTVFQYLAIDTDLTVLAEILKDVRSLASSY